MALALNSADGSVYVVQSNTYVEGCDPTSNAGRGAVVCNEREQARNPKPKPKPKPKPEPKPNPEPNPEPNPNPNPEPNLRMGFFQLR